MDSFVIFFINSYCSCHSLNAFKSKKNKFRKKKMENLSYSQTLDESSASGIRKCFQNFLHRYFFLLLFSLISILQGAYFTYFIGILSTLEKRYFFDSWTIGLILIADNLSPLFFGIFLGYYGKFLHKPRLVLFGMMITVLGCFLSSSPYFLFGSEKEHYISISKIQLCNSIQDEEDCSKLSSQNIAAFVILFLGNFLNGFGSMAYYTVGTPYLDDNVKKKNTPLYLGTTFSLRIVGPTLGFLLSSFCLKYYEDPFFHPGFESSDPKWIGAWWLGFIILGLMIFVVSFPLVFFPKQLTDKRTDDSIQSFKQSLSELFLSLKKMVINPILMFHTLSIVFQINGLFGYFVYMPKYMESQYQKSPSSASLFSGSVTMVAMVVGVFLGGFCIHRIKPRSKFLVGYMLFVEIFGAIVLFSIFFLGCEDTITQSNFTALFFPENQQCSQNCICNRNFSPVCDTDGVVHFSPCLAGCNNYTMLEGNKKGFNNCFCISLLDDADYAATSGFCSKECFNFLPYLILASLAKMLSATARVGNVLVTLRCVDDNDKTLALGAVEFVVSLLATIPYPLIYGYVINQACVLWDQTCKRHGNCWLYDNVLFRNYLHGLSLGFLILAILCDCVVFTMSTKLRNLYGTDKPSATLQLNEIES